MSTLARPTMRQYGGFPSNEAMSPVLQCSLSTHCLCAQSIWQGALGFSSSCTQEICSDRCCLEIQDLESLTTGSSRRKASKDSPKPCLAVKCLTRCFWLIQVFLEDAWSLHTQLARLTIRPCIRSGFSQDKSVGQHEGCNFLKLMEASLA